MATKANLDALIPREDFEVEDDKNQSSLTATIQVMELEPNRFLYPVLRKPDFQRETADWTPERIYELIASFLRGDLIPAVILWNAGRHIFVIDGSHRLSALIAWVHDDYGDGARSRDFFEHQLPEEQIQVAEKTRKLIKRELGSYADHTHAIQYPDRARPDVVDRASKLASLSLSVQWVKGDAEQAEQSFFRINQQATPIDKTELRLLQARRKPNALAARAIVRSGTGHKYWSKFDANRRTSIEAQAKEIYKVLFTPNLKTPIKTLDLPVAGRGYSADTLPLIVDFVDIVNDVRVSNRLDDDPDGDATIEFLRKVRKVVSRISGDHPSSLGLHPAVYFYGASGRYQPTAFLATVGMVRILESRNGFSDFTKVRRDFEEFLLNHKSVANQFAYKYGSGMKGYSPLTGLYVTVADLLISGLDQSSILQELRKNERFGFISFDEDSVPTRRRDFSTDTKSSAFLKEALANTLRCAICGGHIHSNSISLDHIVRKQEGGSGDVLNAQLTHPYCNTTFKG